MKGFYRAHSTSKGGRVSGPYLVLGHSQINRIGVNSHKERDLPLTSPVNSAQSPVRSKAVVCPAVNIQLNHGIFLMKNTNVSSCRLLAASFTIILLTLAGGVFSMAADVFTINSAQSFLTLSGSVQGSSFSPQGTGSMTNFYAGTIQASQTAGTIQFTGGSLITAQTNGNWYPAVGGATFATAPADYGATASTFAGTVYAAMRQIQFDVTSPAINVTSGQFSPAGLTFQFSTNINSTLDYYNSFAMGSKALTGNATNNVATLATLTTVGTTQTLTLGVNALFTFTLISSGDTLVNVSGQIVATRSSAAPLVIQRPAVTNHVVTLKWQSTAGQTFQVLLSTNLPVWKTNASNVTSASTNYAWTGTNLAPIGVYRLVH